MPDLRGNLGISYRQNSHTARFNMRFIGGYEDNASVNNRIDDGQIDAYYSFDLNYSYTMDLNDSALIISLGAIDLFEADLPRLKNANGTDLSTFDIRGRRVYGSVKFIL